MADINPSFMCARDPSIISWNKTRHQLTCKQILTERFDEVTVTAENDEEQVRPHFGIPKKSGNGSGLNFFHGFF